MKEEQYKVQYMTTITIFHLTYSSCKFKYWWLNAKDITRLLTYWSYMSFALSHQFVTLELYWKSIADDSSREALECICLAVFTFLSFPRLAMQWKVQVSLVTPTIPCVDTSPGFANRSGLCSIGNCVVNTRKCCKIHRDFENCYLLIDNLLIECLSTSLTKPMMSHHHWTSDSF